MRLLKANCFSCHNPEKKKGGLVLTTRDALLQGGENGAVFDAEHPEKSKLLAFLGPDSDPHMPPKKQLEPTQIGVVQKWLEAGAPWNAAALVAEASNGPVTLSKLPVGYHPVMALSISPDGQKLAAGYGNRLVVYQLGDKNFPVLADFMPQADLVRSVAWSPDGRWLAAAGFRRIVLVEAQQLRSGAILTNELSERVTALKFSPDSQQLIAADGATAQNGFVRIFNVRSGKPVRSWAAHRDTIFDLAITTNGTALATAGGDKLVKLWELGSGKEQAQFEGHAGAISGLAFNPDGKELVSAGTDKQLKVWDVRSKENIISLGNQRASFTAVSWSNDGKWIAAANETGALFIYSDLKRHTGEQSSAGGNERQLAVLSEMVYCLAFNPATNTVYAGTHDGFVHVLNTSGKVLARLAAPALPHSTNDPIVSLSVSPSRLELITGDRRGLLVTGRTPDGKEVDLTEESRLFTSDLEVASADDSGKVRAQAAGIASIIVCAAGLETVVPVRVQAAGTNAAAVTFVRDIMPVLSKAGCNSGSCHAKAEGQNGFKLSVFSYDPVSDYNEIVKDERGRRVFPAAPEESLLLKKPTMRVEHGGGQRIEPGSEPYQKIVQWIKSGMPFRGANEPALQKITVAPKERQFAKGARQQLLVTAHYSDGAERDVTDLSDFSASDKEIARPDDHGLVRVGKTSGEAVVVARYLGLVDAARIMIPAERQLPIEKYAALPVNNFIDRIAYAKFQKLGLYPSPLCSDAEFLRRASLDAIGTLPPPDEARAFLADADPAKRKKWIQKLLAQPAYADYWASKWADLLRPNPDRVGVKSVFTLDHWLRESFRENKPYDQFAREIILAEGDNHRDGPVVIYRDRREPPALTTLFSQVFLGVRMECARCHHHPNEKWSQDDFYEFAAFFGPLKQKGAGLSPPISAGRELFYFASGGQVRNPVTEQVMFPKPPDGPQVPGKPESDPRRALADWMTDLANPFFAKAAANRIWAAFFGRGIVEPVDDFRISNPASNEPLLDALADDFARGHFDLKHLMRTIMESRLYQLSAEPNEFNAADTRTFSRAYRRRLPAEVLADAVADITGLPDNFTGLPAGSRAVQTWTYKIQSHFLDSFGRPNPSSDCPCERDTRTSVVQSLHLMNSRELQAKLSDPAGRIKQLAASSRSPEEIVAELYLAAYSRFPTPEELKTAAATFAGKSASRQSAAEDVLWALLNSAEFVFNH